MAKAVGADFGQDEEKAISSIQQLWRDAQSLRPLAPHVAAYMQHAPQFTKYLQEMQQKAKEPAQPKQGETPYWSPPEYSESWLNLVRRDEQGNLVALPGAPPDIVHKILAYDQYQREKMGEFTRHPFKFMDPHIESRAREIAEKVIEERLGKQRDQSTAQQFVAEHANWLYDLDPQTRQPRVHSIFDPNTGKYRSEPALSQWGKAFASYVQEEDSRQRARGYHDVDEQKNIAMAKVQRDYAVAQMKVSQMGGMAPSGLTPQQQANQAFLSANNPPAGVPATGAPVQPTTTPVTRANLLEALRAEFKANGITDDTINTR